MGYVQSSQLFTEYIQMIIKENKYNCFYYYCRSSSNLQMQKNEICQNETVDGNKTKRIKKNPTHPIECRKKANPSSSSKYDKLLGGFIGGLFSN